MTGDIYSLRKKIANSTTIYRILKQRSIHLQRCRFNFAEWRDLLNAHVLNGTLAGGEKRVSISLEVKYGTDLERTSTVVENIIKNNEDIIHSLSVDLQFTQISAQGVGIKAYFWIRTSKNDGAVKSNTYTMI